MDNTISATAKIAESKCFYCQIFVNARVAPPELARETAAFFGVEPDEASVYAANGWLIVENNPEFDRAKIETMFEPHFYFPILIHAFPNANESRKNAAQFVADILKFFWTRGTGAEVVSVTLDYTGEIESEWQKFLKTRV